MKGGLVKLNKDSVVDLSKPEELEDLSNLGAHSDDTTNTNHNGDLTLGLKEEASLLLGLTTVGNKVLLDLQIQYVDTHEEYNTSII